MLGLLQVSEQFMHCLHLQDLILQSIVDVGPAT